jgi:hypothetical protein
MGELRLLEVRLDPDVAGLDETEQRRSCADELADLEGRGLRDDAVGRRPYRGLRQRICRLLPGGERGEHGRVAVGGDLGVAAERGERAAHRIHRRGVLVLGVDEIAPRRIERRLRADALLRQRLLPVEFGLVVAHIARRHFFLGLRLAVGGTQLLDIQPCCRQRGLGLRERDPVGFWIDDEEHVAQQRQRSHQDEASDAALPARRRGAHSLCRHRHGCRWRFGRGRLVLDRGRELFDFGRRLLVGVCGGTHVRRPFRNCIGQPTARCRQDWSR